MEQEEQTPIAKLPLSKRNFKLPHFGLRGIKTVISSTLCVILYSFIERNATFACIGAVFGMESDGEHPWKSGGNRLVGTIVGGFLGMGLFYLQSFSSSKLYQIFLLCVGIALLIYISKLFNFTGAIQGGAVVFYIVMLNTPQNQYITYALNRMIDTAVGVSISVGINVLLSRRRLLKRFKNVTD